MNSTHISRESALTDLVTDPDFLRLTALGLRPNLFSCLARTYTETWHSMFLAWLLDPKGSHGLGGYAFALLCRTASLSPWGTDASGWSRLAALAKPDSVEVFPNERNPSEAKFEDASRADVLLRNIEMDGEDQGKKHLVVIEQKVRAPIELGQLNLYQKHATSGSAATFRGLLVAPRDKLEIYQVFFGKSATWTGLDYQMLHDGVLDPCLSHPALPERTRFLVTEYVENLRTMNDKSISVITTEERELALRIWNKHKVALQLLARSLNEPEAAVVKETLSDEDGEGPALEISVNGQPISGETVPEFLEDYLTKLDQLGVLSAAEQDNKIPYKTSDKRYFIARSPVHPAGNPFFRAVTVNGWYAEANRSPSQALARCHQFAEAAGCFVGIKQPPPITE